MPPAADATRPAHAAYLRRLLISVVLLAGAVMAFNVAVDAYGIFGAPLLPGLTAHKIVAPDQQRLAKTNSLARARPRTIVIGSSIANVGIDPDSPAWRPEHRPVFNLGIDGANPPLQQHVLRDAMAVAHPALVVVLLSYEDVVRFVPGPDEDKLHESDLLLARRMPVDAEGAPNPAYRATHAADLFSAVLSMESIRASLRTIAGQSRAGTNELTRSGFEIRRSLDTATALAGARGIMDSKTLNMAPRLLWWQRQPDWPFTAVTRMIRTARAGGADVALVLVPTYIEQDELQRQLGLFPNVLAWRTAIAALVDAEAARPQTSGHVTLWDFQAPSPYTTEALPPGDDTAPLRWFWDTAHFRPALGSLIAARIEGRPDAPPDFGAPLTSATAAGSNARKLDAIAAWEQAHPGDVARVAAIAGTAPALLCRMAGACAVADGRP